MDVAKIAKVEISKKLLHQLEHVKRSGVTNMMDRKAVQVEANRLNLYELVTVAESPQLYSKVLEQYDTPDEQEYQEWLEEQGMEPERE